jgi:hypothetical protein
MCVRAFIDIFLRREGATDISFTSDVFYPFFVTFFFKSPRQEETTDRSLPKTRALKHGLQKALFRFER